MSWEEGEVGVSKRRRWRMELSSPTTLLRISCEARSCHDAALPVCVCVCVCVGGGGLCLCLCVPI